jgi:hypothetical protein
VEFDEKPATARDHWPSLASIEYFQEKTANRSDHTLTNPDRFGEEGNSVQLEGMVTCLRDQVVFKLRLAKQSTAWS